MLRCDTCGRETRLVVIDGLMTLRDLHAGAPAMRTFIYDLGATLAATDVTTVITSGEFGALPAHQSPGFTRRRPRA
jgi:hypothetical protein